MFKIDQREISSFSKKYGSLLACTIIGLETFKYFANGETFDFSYIVESIALFLGFFVLVVLLVSLFRGWITFQSSDE